MSSRSLQQRWASGVNSDPAGLQFLSGFRMVMLTSLAKGFLLKFLCLESRPNICKWPDHWHIKVVQVLGIQWDDLKVAVKFNDHGRHIFRGERCLGRALVVFKADINQHCSRLATDIRQICSQGLTQLEMACHIQRTAEYGWAFSETRNGGEVQKHQSSVYDEKLLASQFQEWAWRAWEESWFVFGCSAGA